MILIIGGVFILVLGLVVLRYARRSWRLYTELPPTNEVRFIRDHAVLGFVLTGVYTLAGLAFIWWGATLL